MNWHPFVEALGIVWPVKHYGHYLYSHHCDITDHEALESLLTPLGSWHTRGIPCRKKVDVWFWE